MTRIEDTSWAKYQVTVPEGVSGDWAVKRFEVSEADARFAGIRASIKGRGGIYPGTYTKLTRRGVIVMSDTPDEIRDHVSFIHSARGRVLIAGLGLGMVLKAVLAKASVESVDVAEKSPDVIALVAEHYADPRLTVHEADIFEFRPADKAQTWDAAWFDIWTDLCGDNLPEMTKLKRRFGRKVAEKGCWGEGILRLEARHTAYRERTYGYGW